MKSFRRTGIHEDTARWTRRVRRAQRQLLEPAAAGNGVALAVPTEPSRVLERTTEPPLLRIDSRLVLARAQAASFPSVAELLMRRVELRMLVRDELLTFEYGD